MKQKHKEYPCPHAGSVCARARTLTPLVSWWGMHRGHKQAVMVEKDPADFHVCGLHGTGIRIASPRPAGPCINVTGREGHGWGIPGPVGPRHSCTGQARALPLVTVEEPELLKLQGKAGGADTCSFMFSSSRWRRLEHARRELKLASGGTAFLQLERKGMGSWASASKIMSVNTAVPLPAKGNMARKTTAPRTLEGKNL